MEVIAPLSGTKTQSEPVGDALPGDDRAARAAAGKVFHETRDTRHETRLFSDTRFETGPFGTEGLQSFFWPGRRFRLKVMTPLSGTKTPSAPVGDAPPGDNRAVRATAAKVFHETRDTRHESRPFSDTKFETGPFGTEGLQSFFWPGDRFRLKVMTPLSGTKTQSEPVGDAPPGDDRAARAAAGKVFTKHETRDTNHGLFQTRSSKQGPLVLKGFSLFFGRETGLG